MEITEVRIRKVDDQKRLRAVATITIDNCFVIHEIKVLEGEEGLFVAMPARKNQAGQYKDLAHPITSEAREYLQKTIIDAFNNAEE